MFSIGLNCFTKVHFIQENVDILNFFLKNEHLCTEKLGQEVTLSQMVGPSPINLFETYGVLT